MHIHYTKADSYICSYHSTISNQSIHCEIYMCGGEHFSLYTTDTTGGGGGGGGEENLHLYTADTAAREAG